MERQNKALYIRAKAKIHFCCYPMIHTFFKKEEKYSDIFRIIFKITKSLRRFIMIFVCFVLFVKS